MPEETRTPEEISASYRYWRNQSSGAIFEEIGRLSSEHYGKVLGDLRDGPFLKYERMPDGSRRILAEWSGPNPLRPAPHEQ